jgi:hypothetical protein
MLQFSYVENCGKFYKSFGGRLYSIIDFSIVDWAKDKKDTRIFQTIFSSKIKLVKIQTADKKINWLRKALGK